MAVVIGPRTSNNAYGVLTTAWITATGESDATILGALNTLESDLNTYGLTSKIKALYPFVGGTSTKHSYNFINTAQYQITWHGGVTHTSNGVTGNGTNGYGDTSFIPKDSFSSSTNRHLSFYLRTNTVGSGDPVDMGSIDNGSGLTGNDYLYNGNTSKIAGELSSTVVQSSSSDRRGHSLISKNSVDQSIFKNGSKLTTTTGTGNSSNELAIFIAGVNISGFFPYGPTVNQFAFASIGDGLTDTEAADFYTAVQAFQTTLGRQV